ncbi:MAG TPA: nuclear transport factor 2 family protein [Chitinophagaceae bacterium]
MKHILTLLIAVIIIENSYAQQSAKSVENEIIDLEKSFAEAIKARDSVRASSMQVETYFLAVGIQGRPLQIIPRSMWLQNLKNYVVESYSFDDIKVNVYGNTAVALVLFTQKATSGGRDRSAQFLLTDIWVKQDRGWVIAERHSSRPEVAPAK